MHVRLCVCVNIAGEGEEAVARAGLGPARSASSVRKPRRPRIVLEHPDITGPEFTIRRSFSIQDGILQFLEENLDTAWSDMNELWIRAANYVYHAGHLKKRPSQITARRWVQQFTAVGEPYAIREGPGPGPRYWVLERRGKL